MFISQPCDGGGGLYKGLGCLEKTTTNVSILYLKDTWMTCILGDISSKVIS